MNTDGSDRRVIASAAAYNNYYEPAAWSPTGDRIAFLNVTSIVVVNVADPNQVTRFTPSDDGWYAQPVWLSDGKRIAFAGKGGLFISDLETGQVNLVAATNGTVRLPLWSHTLSRFAYFEDGNWGDVRLHSLGPDGSDPLMLARFPTLNLQHPAWSNDGRFIAYFAEDSLNVSIARTDQFLDRPPLFFLAGVQLDGGSIGPDTLGLSWLSDSSGFVFVASLDGQADLYLATLNEEALQAYLAATLPATPFPTTPDFDSTLSPFPTPTPFQNFDFYWPSRLTNDPSGNWRPAVSPDGRSIAFASERDGNWDIYLLDLATGAEMRLTDDPLNDMAPSWSPDGTRIAYQHNIPDLNGPVLVDRIVMNVEDALQGTDGSGKTIIASGSVWIGNEPPAWSLTGDQIAFMDSGRIVVVSLSDQRETARFTSPDGSGYAEPVWLGHQQIVFASANGLMIGDVETGQVIPVEGAVGSIRLPMTPAIYPHQRLRPRLAYFAVDGADIRLMSVPNGFDSYMLARLTGGTIQHAAWSRDSRFIAYYIDDNLHVSIGWFDQYHNDAPLSTIPNVSTGLSDLVGVSWLPDSSGFVFVASLEGQPDLYLATFNEAALQVYLAAVPPFTPTPAPSPTPDIPPTLAIPLTPPPTPILAPIPTGTPSYWLLLFSPRYGGWVDVVGQHIWITGLYGSSAYSPDGGGTWSEFGPFGTSVTSIEPSPHFEIDRTIYILAGGVIYRSSDGGTSWKPVASNNGAGYTGISVADDSTIFATSGGRGHCEVHRSLDGGLTWIVQLSDDNCLMTRVAASLEYANDGIVYTLTDNRGLWRSRDRGDTWEQITTNNPADLATDSSNPSTVYMVSTDGDLLRSDNYGDEWLGPLLPAFATAAGIAPNGTVIVGTKDGRVYESTDRGVTWSEISTFSGDPIRDIAATDGVIYVLTERGLLGGYDEGAPLPATPTPLPTP